MYKVFLVEDEILVRERVRDNIDWGNNGFVFAGEASNGEMALPLIKEIKPDILITDIKMQFMDGLELSRIVKKTMSWIKIIILSGYDEFIYAKEAIAINVNEYLLKPVSAADLVKSLSNISTQIDQDKMEGKNYSVIEEKLKNSRQILWERYLSDLATGIIPTNEVVKKADYFGVDIISKYYCALIILLDSTPLGLNQTAYTEYLKAEAIINEKLKGSRDIIKYNVNIKKAILIFKHDDKEELEMNCKMFAQGLKHEIEKSTLCNSLMTIGGIRETVQGIAESIRDAETTMNLNNIFDKNTIVTIEGKYGHIVHKAKKYIYDNYFESEISLNSVADYVNLSPNHLSMVFSQETGLTFIEYLTKVRMTKAKKMLLLTNMRTSEIAFKVGYNDPHYFSNVFKKAVGCAPKNFRENSQTVLSTD